MTVDSCAKIFVDLRGEVLPNESMAKHTALRVGGPADYYATPADLDDLQCLMKAVEAMALPHLIIGGGYNVLIGDAGFRGVVISLKHLSRIEIKEQSIRVEAGVTNQQLVRFAVGHELTGLEFLNDIPGTVGGALSVNAGANGQSIMESVETLVTLHRGSIAEMPAKERDFGYRYLVFEARRDHCCSKFQVGKE